MELWEIGVFFLAVSQIGSLLMIMKLEKKVKALEARTAPVVPDQED